MGKDSYKNSKNYGLPGASSVLLSATQSHKAAAIKHQMTRGGAYGIPDMLKEFGYGAGKKLNDMTPGEKVIYGLALFALAGVVADYTVNEGKFAKATKTKVDKSLNDLDSMWKNTVKKTPAIVVSEEVVQNQRSPDPSVPPVVNASAEVAPTPTLPPYLYNAKEGNPDPGIKFIDGEGDTEFEEILNWHMADLRMRSAYDVEEFEKYLVFRPGKDPTPYDVDFTKDGRRIFYVDNYPSEYLVSLKILKEEMENGRPAVGFYQLVAHLKGHDKFDTSHCASGDFKCTEMPAITEAEDASIRAYFSKEKDREESIKHTWRVWKRHANYTEK